MERRGLILSPCVPNVPCGVESGHAVFVDFDDDVVPNVPCGVERHIGRSHPFAVFLFLMYRVELKGMFRENALERKRGS